MAISLQKNMQSFEITLNLGNGRCSIAGPIGKNKNRRIQIEIQTGHLFHSRLHQATIEKIMLVSLPCLMTKGHKVAASRYKLVYNPHELYIYMYIYIYITSRNPSYLTYKPPQLIMGHHLAGLLLFAIILPLSRARGIPSKVL